MLPARHPEGLRLLASCRGSARGLLVWITLVLFGACGPAAPRVDSTTEPRIISLSPSLTRVVLAVGAGSSIVGVDRFSRDLPGVEDRPSLGGLFSPDLERALALRPTLVLAVSGAQQSSFFAQLRARGVRVEEFEVYTLQDVIQSFRRIGSLTGQSPASTALVERVQAELERIRRSVEGLDRPRVALVLERDPLYVVGGGAFLDTLIGIAGGQNVFHDLAAPYPRVSLETLAARTPALILDTSAGARSAAPRALHGYWGRFLQPVRVARFPFTATLPAPNLTDATRLLRAVIHPEPHPS